MDEMKKNDEKLCPLKRKPQSPLTGEISFGCCDKEKYAWWINSNKTDGWCAVQTLGCLSDMVR
jgi:hypothetical protein